MAKTSKARLLNAIRPMIKECVKEVIFEEGVLRTLIAETIIGVLPLVETAATTTTTTTPAPVTERAPGPPAPDRWSELRREVGDAVKSAQQNNPYEKVYDRVQPLNDTQPKARPVKRKDAQARTVESKQPLFPEEAHGGAGVNLDNLFDKGIQASWKIMAGEDS